MSSTHSREQWLPLLSGASYTTSPKQNQATRLDPKPRLPRHSRTAAVNSDEVAFPPGVSMEANWSQFTAAQGSVGSPWRHGGTFPIFSTTRQRKQGTKGAAGHSKAVAEVQAGQELLLRHIGGFSFDTNAEQRRDAEQGASWLQVRGSCPPAIGNGQNRRLLGQTLFY